MLKKLNKNKLQALIKERLITERKHPTLDLYIYNYTPNCMYKGEWNEYTRACRGLIADSKGNIIQRPFEKFFNYGEPHCHEIPLNEPFVIQKKVDGSLGILYWEKNLPAIASRGSFTSDQAIEGTKILREKYKDVKFDKRFTYLFEIIYPSNKIVVDYKEKDLVLLAIIDTQSNKNVNPETIYKDDINKVVSVVGTYQNIDFSQYSTVKDIIEKVGKEEKENEEGYVFYFLESNIRIKVKFEEYCRLHRLIFQTTARVIWEILKNSQDQQIEEILDRVPEDFSVWVKEWVRKIKKEVQFLRHMSEVLCKWISKNTETRKEFANVAEQAGNLTSLIFYTLDGKFKHREEAIWKIVKPAHEVPFKIEE